MPNLFGLDIAKIVNDNLGSSLLPLTLIKVATTTLLPAELTAGGTTETSSSGRGILEDYMERQIDGTVIQSGDRKVLILGASLPSGVIPEPNDKVTIEGATFYMVNVIRDPAAASYTCQVRV